MENRDARCSLLRLAHNWRLDSQDLPREVIRKFIRPAVRSIPRSLAVRLKRCRISLSPRLADATLSSQWTESSEEVVIEVASGEVDGHDLAMEILVCVGQVLWEAALPGERAAYLSQLASEIEAGVPGEIDEDALREKRALLGSPVLAGSGEHLERYARASFASSLAEYVHCLWHHVTVRTGPDHLPAAWLRRRLEMLARWFPPNPEQRLFSRRS